MGLKRYLSVLLKRSRGKEPVAIIDDHSVDIEFRYPKDTDSYTWDDDLYVHGQMYVRDHSNPVKITDLEKAEDFQLISSKKYRNFMQQEVLKDAFDTFGRSEELLRNLMLANLLGMFVLIMLIVVGLFG